MTMQGIYLKLFVPEALRHHKNAMGDILYEWILQQAQAMGIPGGSAVRAVAGFGRHGHLHEQHFFELAGDVPIVLEFFAEEEAIGRLLALLKSENIVVFYVKFSALGGLTNQ
jgi:PII-like signaling protein